MNADIERLIILLVTGAIAGWLSGLIVKGRGFGLLGNIVVGIIGAVLGTLILDVLNIHLSGEWIDDVARAVIGAIVLVFIVGVVRKRNTKS